MTMRALVLMLILGTAASGRDLSPLALGRIDAHAHFLAEAKPVLDVLDRLNVTAVNVCVVDRYDEGYETVAPQHAMARQLARVSRGRLPWIATFDDAGFAGQGFAARTLGEVDRALAEGAIGVKVYKSLGMELRDVAVDTAARVVHLMLQPRDKVRSFLLRHSDRVLYGTDFSVMPGQDAAEAATRLEAEYARDWAWFATADAVEVDGRKVQGLALPAVVLRKVFRENALRWVPGIAATAGRER